MNLKTITVSEVSLLSDLPEDVLRAAINDGLLVAIEDGRETYVDLDELPESIAVRIRDRQEERSGLFELDDEVEENPDDSDEDDSDEDDSDEDDSDEDEDADDSDEDADEVDAEEDADDSEEDADEDDSDEDDSDEDDGR